jgi:arginase
MTSIRGVLHVAHRCLREKVPFPRSAHPFAQNAGQVLDCLRQLADRLDPLLAGGDRVLVIGGNCTIALAVMAALQRLDTDVPGLLYFDRQFDLNTPNSTTDGALDWMGLAHGLALAGCVDAIADAFGRRPLLQPSQVAWLGVDPTLATEWERDQAARLALHITSGNAGTASTIGARRSAALPWGSPEATNPDHSRSRRTGGRDGSWLVRALRGKARDHRFAAGGTLEMPGSGMCGSLELSQGAPR